MHLSGSVGISTKTFLDEAFIYEMLTFRSPMQQALSDKVFSKKIIFLHSQEFQNIALCINNYITNKK